MCSHYTDLQEYSKCMLQSYIEKVRHKFMADKNYSELSSHIVLDQLVDDITLEVVAEYHRAIVKGYADHVYPSKVEEKHESEALSRESESCNEQLEKKVEDIKCPNCTHPINASRFAPHLEKCMRIGRSSSRIASRRIASNSKDSNYAALSDDEDDEDWNSGNKKNKIIKKFEQKKKKEIKKSNKLLSRDNKSGKGDSRSKDECVDWLTSPKMQLSPISSSRLKRGVHDMDTEAEDTSTTPSPADSNSTSSGSASRRKDRVKSKRKVPKNYRYSEEPDSAILRG